VSLSRMAPSRSDRVSNIAFACLPNTNRAQVGQRPVAQSKMSPEGASRCRMLTPLPPHYLLRSSRPEPRSETNQRCAGRRLMIRAALNFGRNVGEDRPQVKPCQRSRNSCRENGRGWRGALRPAPSPRASQRRAPAETSAPWRCRTRLTAAHRRPPR